jgi:hypothetical protein
MGSLSTRVRLIGPPEADGEYVALRENGIEEIVHLHDYPRLYRVPGLYEHIVQELLACRSPQVAAEALARALERLALEPARVRLLDLGAGTGLVGELVRALGIVTVVGLDALAAAREACLRDRPGVYSAYVVGNLADPGPELLAELRAQRPGGLIAAGAFGGTHMPGSGLVNALAPLPPGAPVVFTIAEDWTRSDGPGGFRTVLARLLASGELQLLERSRFQHRLTTAGEPVYYELVVAAKGPAVA